MSSIMFSHDLGFILINWMLGLLILNYKIKYHLWFVCQWIQFIIWFLELDISCDLFGYGYNWWFDFIPRKQRRACFRFLNISFNDDIFHDSKIDF